MSAQFYPPAWVKDPRVVLDSVLAVAPAPVGVLEPQLVLIGGWGTWFHTGGLHSYDICLIASPGGL
ncbi:MAG: hypothetical protein ACRDX8_09630, partial [Acidimicrobiales bacterium]